jgi:pyrrolidone-carboxylate peptidase
MALFSSTDAANNIVVPAVSYIRTDEEKIGVASSVGPDFFEDGFINEDSGSVPGTKMRDIVDAFKAALLPIVETTANAQTLLEGHIDNYGLQIFDRGVALAKNAAMFQYADRILYWTRISMIVELKKNAFVLNNTNKQISVALAKRFDGRSRGQYTVNLSTPDKKILISGFDPYGLFNNRFSTNPSGSVALALHNEVLVNGAISGKVQSVLFPVRYRDFDDNVVEDTIRPHIDPSLTNNADMVLSISQNGSLAWFDVERFLGRLRSGRVDNERKTFPPSSIGNSSTSNEFYESKLPVSHMVPGPFTIPPQRLFYDQSYESSTAKTNHYTWVDTTPPNTNTNSFPITDITGTAISGSGGQYLSNECGYRIARLRDSFTAPPVTAQTGHLHIPDHLGVDLYMPWLTIEQIRDVVKEAIERALLGL